MYRYNCLKCNYYLLSINQLWNYQLQIPGANWYGVLPVVLLLVHVRGQVRGDRGRARGRRLPPPGAPGAGGVQEQQHGGDQIYYVPDQRGEHHLLAYWWR